MSKKKAPKLRLKNTKVETGFSTATYKPNSGKSTYTLSAPLQEMRDKFYGAANDVLDVQPDQQAYADEMNQYGQGLFSQGQSLLDQAMVQEDPTAYYQKLMAQLEPNRAQEEARLADTLFKSGRTGAAVARGEGYLNPEQFALLKAREEANLGMALSAEDRVRALQNQDIAQATGIQSLGLGYQDTANSLAMRPWQNASTLFGIGTGIEGLGRSDLELAIQQGATQLAVDQAITANKAARQGGGFMGGLGGSLLNAGLNYATGGISGAVQSVASGGGVSSLFSGLGSMFNTSSPSSGLFGSLGLTNNGFTNLVAPINATYAPINSGIGMGGYQAPANFGGGTIAPRFY